MAIEINGLTGINPIPQHGQQVKEVKQEPEKSFSNILKTAVNKVSQQENESERKVELLAQGKIDNLHDVMITAQKATISVETAVQVQQKVIDTYNEMMRMQI